MVQETGRVWWGGVTESGRLRFAIRAQLIRDRLAGVKDPLVMEIGCGAGAFTRPLLEAIPDLRLIGTDVSEKCLELARKECAAFAGARFECVDAESLAKEKRRFHAIVGNGILHHLDEERILEQCREILIHKGVIVFFEPNMMNPQIAIQKNVPFIKKMLGDTPTETAFFRWKIEKLLHKLDYGNIVVEPFDFLHPIIPGFLTKPAEKIGAFLERVPFVREIAGSLYIKAERV